MRRYLLLFIDRTDLTLQRFYQYHKTSSVFGNFLCSRKGRKDRFRQVVFPFLKNFRCFLNYTHPVFLGDNHGYLFQEMDTSLK